MRQRPASQMSFADPVHRLRKSTAADAEIGPHASEVAPAWTFLRSLHGSSLSPFPKLDPVC